MSPQGVCHFPKSAWRVSQAAANAWSSVAAGALFYRSAAITRRRTSSPQNTASEVGTEPTDHRQVPRPEEAICSAVFAFSGLSAGVWSQAWISAGSGFSNHVR